jgi:putative hemolysin
VAWSALELICCQPTEEEFNMKMLSKELQAPAFASSPIQVSAPLRGVFPFASALEKSNERVQVHARWAQHQDEVRAAQRLRYQIFVGEMGARIATPVPGHDVDKFDDYCEHLIVCPKGSEQVIGTYRVLTPSQTKRLGYGYCDTEFDLSRLVDVRAHAVELGRSCVHAQHRQGNVIMALWSALGEFMQRNKLDTMIGSASIPMLYNGLVNPHVAASVWRQVQTRMAPPNMQARPRLPLPIETLDADLPVEPPALIKAYLRLGAKVLGAPAWDPDFNTADLPMMISLNDLPARYRKHFLEQ